MTKDPLTARRMVLSRRAEYEAVQQKSLILQPLPADLIEVTSSGGDSFLEFEAYLQPDDLRVFVFTK
jgi:hypothetical protein